MPELIFTLSRLPPPHEYTTTDTINLRTLARVFTSCERMLSYISKEMDTHHPPHARWRVSATRTSSITFEVERDPPRQNDDQPSATANVISETVSTLRREHVLTQPDANEQAGFFFTTVQTIDSPQHSQAQTRNLSTPLLRRLREVAASLRSGGEEHLLSIAIGPTDQVVQINHTMTEQIDNLLRKEYASLGSIDGTLEMVSLRNNRRFHISYNNTGKTVKCDLPTHLEQEVIKALGRQVTVFGVIYRNIDGLPLHVDVHTVTLLENTYTPIPLSELMGSLPNITDGLSTEEFLDTIRHDRF